VTIAIPPFLKMELGYKRTSERRSTIITAVRGPAAAPDRRSRHGLEPCRHCFLHPSRTGCAPGFSHQARPRPSAGPLSRGAISGGPRR
jgi:hypothetical protein